MASVKTRPVDRPCPIVDCCNVSRVLRKPDGTFIQFRFCVAHEGRKRRLGSPTARTCRNRKCGKIVDNVHLETHVIEKSGGVFWCDECLMRRELPRE